MTSEITSEIKELRMEIAELSSRVNALAKEQKRANELRVERVREEERRRLREYDEETSYFASSV